MINGIKINKEEVDKLSYNVKFGTMGLSSAIMWLKIFSKPSINNILLHAFGATIAAPIIIGTTFCLGTYTGRAIKELDSFSIDKVSKKYL